MMMCLPPVPPRSHLVDDFANRAAGSLVGQGWSNIDSATNASWTISTDGTTLGGRKLTVEKTSTDARRRISFDAAATPSDVEVLVRVKLVDDPGSGENSAQVYIRSGVDHEGYFADFVKPSGETHSLSELTGATSAAVRAEEPFDYNTTNRFWCRLRMVGNTIEGKHWADGGAEPAFQLSDTDDSLASGYVGLGTFFENCRYEVDYFAVALGGATAPGPAG